MFSSPLISRHNLVSLPRSLARPSFIGAREMDTTYVRRYSCTLSLSPHHPFTSCLTSSHLHSPALAPLHPCTAPLPHPAQPHPAPPSHTPSRPATPDKLDPALSHLLFKLWRHWPLPCVIDVPSKGSGEAMYTYVKVYLPQRPLPSAATCGTLAPPSASLYLSSTLPGLLYLVVLFLPSSARVTSEQFRSRPI